MDDLKEADPFIMMGYGIMDFGKGGYPSAANLFNENGFDNYYNIEVGGAHDWGVWRELLSIFAKDYLWVRELERLVIDKAPAKTVYKEGETFDPAGMEVTAVYADGSTADVTDKAKFAPDGKLELDDKRVNVFYTEEKITVASYVNITVEKPAAHPFIDVPAGSYFEDAVTWAYNAKPQITDGNGKDLFMPYQYCTRGQVVTFLWRTMGCPEPKTKVNPFDDVTKDDYFYKPVLWAVEKGITDGTTETTFSPYNQCRNSHILTFIWRTLGRPGDTGAEKTTEWWADAEKWAKKEGLLAETYTDWFDVKDLCPRCNVVTFLYRALVK
ncbi:MAG: S-layer homology domain-containing protein [Firmicutes bacterium]|nr:S-layer homology domain-containing protein [Bacillota bacterium]